MIEKDFHDWEFQYTLLCFVVTIFQKVNLLPKCYIWLEKNEPQVSIYRKSLIQSLRDA